MTPSLSIVMPIYNRAHLLRHPLSSLREAAKAAPGLVWEVIIVDDGSTEDLAAAVAPFSDLPLRLHRQENRGLLTARLVGLSLARHEAVMFLDGDDLVASGKFATQLPALDNADVTYGDVGRVELDSNGESPHPMRIDLPLTACTDPAEFYLGIQPGPHNPIFRRSYLTAALDNPICPPLSLYDPIAEAWYYYQLAIQPARIIHVPGVWTIVGDHHGERISHAWERQAYAALHLMRSFMRSCPVIPATEAARRRIGVCAFATWRALPYAFAGFPTKDYVAIWRAAPAAPLSALGRKGFRYLALFLGPVLAGLILRRLKRSSYASIRTLDDAQLAALTHE